MRLELPFPNSRLFPNRKANKDNPWYKWRPLANNERQLAKILTRSQLPAEARERIAGMKGRIYLTVRFIQPDRRHRDDDGMVGAFKHLRDGIADALKIDDRRFRCSYEFAEEPEKPGRVEVDL